MPNLLTPATIAIVKATVPALADHGPAITTAMYQRLFADPEARALFNQGHQGEGGAQVHALAGAILAYARNIENLGALGGAVERIAQKHIGYHILPEHYPHVANALLPAIAEVLGDAATDEILTAWGEAYWFLASILQGREGLIRDELDGKPGGWTGWRKFIVDRREKESDVITSFILKPLDGKPVIQHRPGQYLTLRLAQPDGSDLRRNYSISSMPNDFFYRISVKREPLGQASRWLHDEVRVGEVIEATPPAGDFFLPERPERPVILLSGGVGLTPMVSMIETIASRHPEVDAHFVHAALHSGTHAMRERLRELSGGKGRVTVTTFYSEPRPGDEIGRTHDHEGFVTSDWLRSNTPLAEADVFLCGPKPFLRAMVVGLRKAGVPDGRVHYEFFGPADELEAA